MDFDATIRANLREPPKKLSYSEILDLEKAVCEDNIECVRLYITDEYRRRVCETDEITLLMLSIQHHSSKVTDFLINRDEYINGWSDPLFDRTSYINERSFYGETALHYAVLFRNIYALRLLLRYGAKVNAVENHGNFTPLHYATHNTHRPGLIRALINAGADYDLVDCNGETPYSSTFGREERVPDVFEMRVEFEECMAMVSSLALGDSRHGDEAAEAGLR
jgi:hypothetical protein